MGLFKLMRKAIKVAILAMIASRVYNFLCMMNFGRIIHSHDAVGPCNKIPGIEFGAEDIEVLPSGIAFISSGLDPRTADGQPIPGSIYKFDLNKPDQRPEKLKIIGKDFDQTSFRPHGLSLYQKGKDGLFIFISNHDPKGESVEKFQYDSKANTLTHMATVKSDLMVYVNDVVAIGENQFYFTNSFYYPMPPLEIITQLPWGNVGFYNGDNVTIATSGLHMANGIIKSTDSKVIYVANNGQREVVAYVRQEDNTLTVKQRIPTDSMVDNMNVNEETGELWAAGHPVGSSLFYYLFYDRSKGTPSQVLRFKLNFDNSVREVYEAFADNGNLISGSSVAARFKDKVIVGTIYRDMHLCKIVYLNSD